MNEKKELIKLIKSKLLNMDFDSLLQIIREVNSYNYELEEYSFYDNDEYFFKDYYENPGEAVRATQYGDYHYPDDYVLVNGCGNLDTYDLHDAKTLIYDDIEYISEIITEDFITEKAYNLFFYDEL